MNYGQRPNCPSDRHDAVNAAKRHGCTCPAAREARNAQQRRQRARRGAAPRNGLDPQRCYALTIRRVTRGDTQADVAAQVGVNVRTVGTWERGERTPDPARLAAWKAAVGYGEAK